MVQVHASIMDYPHPGLNPNVWGSDGKLLPEHKELIEKILIDDINNEGLKDPDKWIKKVKIIGGITTYQYTFDSDIDIHVEVDLPKFIQINVTDMTPEQAHEYLNTFRSRMNELTPNLPNTEHKIEYYFETPFVNREGSPRSGLYNITTDEWEIPPVTVDMEFSIEDLAKSVVDAANDIARELDISFGEMRRDIRRIEDLRDAADAWNTDQKKVYENKIQERLTNIEAEIANIVIERDEIIKDRRNYDPMGDAEIKFKYLQRFGYINLITTLNQYVKDDGKITEDEIPDIRKDLLELGLKEASLGKKAGYEYSCVMVDIPNSISKEVQNWGKDNIPEKDIYEGTGDEADNYGREDETHVTVLFGLHTNKVDEVKEVLKDQTSPRIKLGKVKHFSPDDKPYDVVIVEVISPDLNKLNKLLTDNFEYTTDHPDYNPHMTIAYVKRGKAEQYDGESILDGEEVEISKVLFSPAEGEKSTFELSKTASDKDPKSWPGAGKLMIDFDNTIADNDKAEYPEIGDPFPEAKVALEKLKEKGWEIIIYSCRANEKKGIDDIKEFLDKHEIPYDDIFEGKPMAEYYIDDRNVMFTDWKEVLKQVKKEASSVIKVPMKDRMGNEYDVNVFKNPTVEQAENLFNSTKDHNVRMYTDSMFGDIYIWDAYYAIHSDMARALGFEFWQANVASFGDVEPLKKWIETETKDRAQYASKKASLMKVAALTWFTPEGQVHRDFELDPNHYGEFLSKGWVAMRAEDPRSVVVLVDDLEMTPEYVNNYLADVADYGSTVIIQDKHNNQLQLRYPFKNLQRTIQRELYKPIESKKIASSSILNIPNPRGLDIRVYVNPTSDQVVNLLNISEAKELRWFVDADKLYVWDAFKADHSVILPELGYTGDFDDMAYWDEAGVLANEENVKQLVDEFQKGSFSKKADFLPSVTPHAPTKRWGPTDVEIPVDPDAASEEKEWFHGEHADKPRNRKWWKRVWDWFTDDEPEDLDKKADGDVDQILQLTQQNGGATWNFEQGNLVGTDNYAVSTSLDRTQKIPANQLTLEVLQAYIDANKDLLSDSNNSLGTWNDGGTVYLDIVTTLADRDEAIELGKRYNQKAIFDLKNLEEILTGGTGEVLSALDKESYWEIGEDMERYWIAPNGNVYPLGGASIHINWIANNIEILNTEFGMNIKPFESVGNNPEREEWDYYQNILGKMLDAGWARAGDVASSSALGIQVADLYNVPQGALDFVLSSDMREMRIEDDNKSVMLSRDQYPNAQKEIRRELTHQRAASLTKSAYTLSGYWIAPSGEAYEVRGAKTYSHGEWVWRNRKALVEQGISEEFFGKDKMDFDYFGAASQMLENGWARVGDLRGHYGAEVYNIRQIPSSLEDFLPTVMSDGNIMVVADLERNAVQVEYPWKSLQNAVNQSFRKRRFAKQARPRPKHRTDWTDTRFDLEPFSPLPTTFQKDINEKNLNWRHPWKYMGRPKGKGHSDQGDVTEILLQQEEPLSELEEKESKKLPMDKDDLIEEHKRIVKVLKSPSHKDDAEEAKKQEKELEEYKEASFDDREAYWISPEGEINKLLAGEEHWDWLREYHLDRGIETSTDEAWPVMIQEGWIRAIRSDGDLFFDLQDMKQLPSFLEKFVIERPGSGRDILIEDHAGNGSARFPYDEVVDNGLQKAVNRALQQKRLVPAKKQSSTYTDKEMEEYYKEQHDMKEDDGGGFTPRDFNHSTTDFPKPENLERPKVRLDRLDETVPVIPSYEVTWVFSLPKDEYHGDYPDEEYVKTHGI